MEDKKDNLNKIEEPQETVLTENKDGDAASEEKTAEKDESIGDTAENNSNQEADEDTGTNEETEIDRLKRENRRLRSEQKRFIMFWKKSVSVLLAVSLLLFLVCVVQTCRVLSVNRALKHNSTVMAGYSLPAETDVFEENTTEGITAEGSTESAAVKEQLPETAPQVTDAIETPAVQAAVPEQVIPAEPTGSKMVYLTFDDGPSKYTDYVLDTLAQYGIKATFFVVLHTDEASTAKYQRIVNEGHVLALHSVSHDYDTIYANIEAFAADVQGLRDYLTQVTGYTPWLYRFPGGSRSVKFSGRVPLEDCINWLNASGITYADWNVSSGDSSNPPISAEQITANIMDSQYSVVNASTPIVLMHDASDKAETMRALPGLIERILALGYQIGPITPDTPLVHQSLD